MQFVFLCVCVCVFLVEAQDTDNMKNMPKYDSRYDYLDVDALFNSKRLVRNYIDCLINGLRCTPEGKALKRLLPEALRTKCVRCTERQKKIAVKIIKRLKGEYPDEWAKLAAKWDPTGDFTRYFEVFLANEQFNTISNNNGNNLPAPTIAPPRFVPTDPAPMTNSPQTMPPAATVPDSTPPRPVVLNRFGDDGGLMVPSTSLPRTTAGPTTTPQPRPTPVSWDSAPTASNMKPTRFPPRPTNDFITFTTTAATIIDHIGVKILRTTALISDILRNTVRAVVGR